jgi:prepilin-type N-terminal cleavage/methylation domain-containing protein/prepilin-type processing-associated H-X9-DG protein
MRHGFTLIELLVTIAITAVLIGLLLPAIQQIRGAAARIKCGNQIKQIVLAAHSAHDSNGSLPPGIGHYPASTSKAYGTAFYFLLPYLEQNNLYQRSYSRSSGWYFVGNYGVYSTEVQSFICPSDPSAPKPGIGKDLMGNNWGVTSYGVNAGAACLVDSSGLIISPERFARMPSDFADGTANTILFAEKYAQCFNANYPAGGNYWAYYFTGANLQPFHPGFAVSWNTYSVGPASKFQVTPNPYNGKCDPTMASSPHSGGIQVGMADGSVRFLSANITMYTWWYLCTPSGGEVIPSEAF